MTTGQLMFEVGIKETDNQLTELENRLKKIVTNYGKLELKVQVDGLKAFTSALESIGQSKGLDALQKRIDVLQVTLANVGMSGAKSIQEFEAAVKTTSAVAEQYTQRINQMTAARDKFANGSTQWMSLNNKLTDFQNDKQVIAIYAQEQVAIKNLEDAKARLSNTNAQEVESYQKVISSIETLSNAANTLKTALGSWDAGKGNIAQLVEQFEKLHKEISGIATSLKGIDPSKLNFSGLNINVGKIAGLGDLNSAIRGLEVSINDIIRLFSNLANAVKLQPLDDQVKALLERCERAETKLREVGEAARYLNERAGERTQQKSQNIAGIAGLNEENVERVSNLFERYRKLLADVQNQTANIGGIQSVAEKLGLNPTIVDQAAKRFEALWKTIENSMVGMEKYKGFPVLDQSSNQLAKLRAEFSALLSEYKLVTQESNNYNKAAERSAKAQQHAQERIQNAAKRTSENLGTLTDRLDAKKLNFKGMDFTELDTAIGKIRAIKAELENFATTGRSSFGNTAKEIVQTMGLAQANEEARMAVGHLTTGKREAEKANKELSDSEQRLANAVKGTSDSMRGQSQVLSDLKMMATQYLSVWGAQSFISNIIETGGLLEQQRLSLSAILGDMGKAQTLFDQIKGMALKSPFGVVELDKMSKQLAAYSFEYEELFEWTKRLADISAATGTSVDRLALALGHVRSEGALSGYTLRQFAMANVPVLRMLSENLGISSKEVRERVKKKDISAEDVQDILKQLTDDGGMFANAQETMSEALNAKFKNLRDAFDIMYGEIAESGIGDKLKDLAVILTNGAKHWERLATDVKDVAIAFGIGKLAMLMYNTALGKGTAITLKSALASKQKEIANLELTASYRKLTASEQATMANATKLNATNISTLLSTKKLTYAELERAVALGKVDKAVALSALGMQKMHKQMALLRQVAPLQGFARIWAVLTYNIKLASAAVKSFMASAWPLLALTAVFELWNRRSEQRDNANDMAKNTAGNTRGREAYEMRDSLADSRKLSSEALKQNISEMQEALIAANAYTDELKKQVDATNDLATKYDLLKDKIGEVSDAYEEQKNAQEAMLKDAWGAVEGEWYNPLSYFEDNMLEDTKQFDTAMAEFQKKLTIASKQIKGVLSEWLQNQGLYDEAYAKMTGKQIFESLGKDTQSSFLNYAWNARGLDDTTSEMLRDISVAYNKVGDKLADMSGEQGEKFANIMKAIYEESFHVDLSKAEQEQVNAFDKWLKDTLARAEGLSNDAKEALRNIVIDFTVTLKPNYVVDQTQTPQEVVASQIGDNKWLSGFFGRQNGGIPLTWTPEQAQKEVKKYKQLFGDISLSNLDTAPKKLNTLLDGLEETKKNLQNTLSSGLLSDDENAEIQKSLDETSDSIDKANKALKDVGAKRQRKGDKGGKKGNDNALEKAKRQLEEIKKFYNEYKKFRDIYGEEKGQNIVENIFGVEHEDANRIINDYEGSLRSIVNELKKSKGGLTSEQRKKFKIDVDSLIGDIKLDKDKQKLDYAMKELQEYLAKRTEQWNLYNQLLEGTGDKDYAMSAFSNKRIFDDAAREFEKKLKEISHETSIDYTMTEAAAEKYYKDVKGGYELWKKISEITSKNYLDSLNKGSEAWKQNMSYAERISAIIAKYTELINRARAAGDPRGAFSFTEQMRKEISGVKMEELRESIDWESVFNDLDKLTVKKLREIKEKLQAMLDSGELDVKDAQILADKILETENKISEKSSFWASMLPFLKQRERLTRNVAKAEKEAADARHEYEVANSRRGMLAFNMAQGSNGAFTPDALLNMTQEEYLKALGLDGLPETDESVQNAINAFNELTESTYALNKAEKKKSSAEIRLENAQNILSGFTNDGLGGLFNNAVEANGGGTLGIVEVVNQNIQSMKELTETLGIADSDLGKAVSDIADISGNLVGAIKSLANGDVFGAINHVVKAGISIGNLFGLGQDDSEFEHAKANYEKLVNVWDELIDRKKTYLNQSWGSEAMNAAEEAVKLLNASIEETKIYGRSALGRGASAGSHSMRYRMWEGSYSYNGQNWQDVAGEISRALNVPFNQMEDMLNMSSKQLLWIKENYTGLWAEMDDDFKAALEQLIKYGDELQDVLDAANAKLSGLTYDGLIESYYNFVTAAEKGNDVLADDLESKLKEAIVKGMIENLYQDRIKAILEKSQELGTNDYYVDKNGKIKQHTRNAAGEITTDKSDIASEYTEKEYKLLMEMSEDLGKDEENTYNMLKEMYGWQDSKSTGLSSNIKNISEETADIIASYVNAMRADVAVNRQMISQYFPMYYQAMTTGNQSLKNIENHTSAIMQSNETIAGRISALDDKVNGLKNGTWRIPVA